MKKIHLRKLLALFLVGTMLGTVGCKDYDDDIDSINKKIDDIEKVKLPGIEEQIGKVKASIPDISALTQDVSKMQGELSAVTAKLGTLEGNVNNLTGKFSEITDKLTELTGKLGQVETAANQYAADKNNLAKAEDITKLRGDLEGQIGTLKNTLETTVALKSELDAYLKKADVKDDATIKALTDAQTALEGSITSLTGKLNDLTDPAKLAWQGKTFDDYVKSLGYVKTTYTDNEAQQAVIDAITKDNEKYNQNYVNALVELVKNAEVGMDGQTAVKVSDLVARQNEYKAALDALTARVDALEVRIDELIGRIQSIQYVPEYNDGKATVVYSKIIDKVIYSDIEMTYEVRPADVAQKLQGFFDNGNASYFSYKLEKVATRAAADPALVIKSIKAVDAASGRFVVTASAENFAEGFTSNDPQAVVSYSAALSIEVPASDKGADKQDHADGITRTTAYTNLAAKADMELVYALKNTTESSTEIVKGDQTARQVVNIEFDNTTGVKPMASYMPVYCDVANSDKLYTPEELAQKGYTVPAYTQFEVTFAVKDEADATVEEANSPFAVTAAENYADYVVAMKTAQTPSVKGYNSTGTWTFYFGDKKDGNKLTVKNVITVGGTVIERNLTDVIQVWNFTKQLDYKNGIVIESPVVLAENEQFSTTHTTLAAMLAALTGGAQGNGDVIPEYVVTELGATEAAVTDAVKSLNTKSGADNTAEITLDADKVDWGKRYRIEAKYEFEDITYNLTLAEIGLDGLSQKEFTYTIPTETLTIAQGTGNVEKTYTVDALYTANSTVIDKYFGEDATGKNAQLNFSKFMQSATAAATASAKTKDETPLDISLDANTKLAGTFATSAPANESDPYMQIHAVIAADDVQKVGIDNAITFKNEYTAELNKQAVKVTVHFVAKLALPEITVALDKVSSPDGTGVFDAAYDGTTHAYGLSKAGFPSYFLVSVDGKQIASSDFAAKGIALDFGEARFAADGTTLTYKGTEASIDVTGTVKYHGIATGQSASIKMSQPDQIFKKIEYKTATMTYAAADGTKTINLDKSLLSITDRENAELIIGTGDGTNIFAQITGHGNALASVIYGAKVEVGTAVLTLADGTTSPTLEATVNNYSVTISYPTTASAAMKLTIPIRITSDYMAEQTGGEIVIDLTSE